ncbi:hypothetical protein N7495_002531 [Penicillium taxi]|uniref:uncharacterized protein n=1 Tax=Penicillium taxi TaxID=168475 RepID=UPI0025456D80|nr:uncharacterized protein N7495_002531 [Penicillium taxi]KAJ5902003.1 hypothetical protein N7495_002531 [Penicillium taxi]
MAPTLTGGNPHIVHLPSTTASSPSEPRTIIQQWFTALENQLSQPHSIDLINLFHSESWWRDMIALDWDMRTMHTAAEIQDVLRKRQSQARLSHFQLQDKGQFKPKFEHVVDGICWISSMFFFETAVGKGAGMVRLTQTAEGGPWKAYAVYTSLQKLKGVDEPLGKLRPEGTTESMPGGLAGGTWIERRERQKEFLDEEPVVLVVGAGQSGLNMGARLQSLGLSCLIVDKQERIGDNWRNRYRTLVTHDPAEFTHMAYLPFPQNWPQFTPKDKLGDWFEAYASIMELNVWLRTSVASAERNDATSTWNITVSRGDGSLRTLHPRHVIWCTGHSGEALIPKFPGQDSFQGVVYHGSQHREASESDVHGKKVIVVGTGNSGHDIAQNYYENGADVTMLQRSGTYVISADKGVHMMHEGMHEDGGPPTEEADIVSESLPNPVQFALGEHFTQRVAATDKETLDGLRRAGFKLDFGPNGAGILCLYYTRGGGYYIDVGCSQLIVDGKIKIKQSPNGINGFGPRELHLADGSSLPADIVVLATGYDTMRSTVRKVLGDKIANRCVDVWDLDEEGELRGVWRPSGQQGFWYFGGNLAICRIYSKFLALQIKAVENGLSTGIRQQQSEVKI